MALRPIGARSRNFLSMYFCHRSQGSMTCMSESIALKPFFAISISLNFGSSGFPVGSLALSP